MFIRVLCHLLALLNSIQTHLVIVVKFIFEFIEVGKTYSKIKFYSILFIFDETGNHGFLRKLKIKGFGHIGLFHQKLQKKNSILERVALF